MAGGVDRAVHRWAPERGTGVVRLAGLCAGVAASLIATAATAAAPGPFQGSNPPPFCGQVRDLPGMGLNLTPSEGATSAGLPATRQPAATLTPGSGYPGFGSSVAISGSTAVVGAPLGDSAYVFARSGRRWHRQAKLTVRGLSTPDTFGGAVAISGSTVVVGGFETSGTSVAYVFARSRTGWYQQAALRLRGVPTNSFGGSWVAISGATVVVGTNGANGVNGAYVFVNSGGRWSQQAKLVGPKGDTAALGTSVAISGSTAVVGGPATFSPDPHNPCTAVPNGPGAAYVFTRTGSAWHRAAKLNPSQSSRGDQYGWSVAIS